VGRAKKPYFKRVAVVGVGLIGGSLAIELRGSKMAGSICGVGRGLKNLKTAKRLGIIDEYTTDVLKGVADADLIVLAVPVSRTAGLVKAAANALKPGAIVTDVGSVKKAVVEACEPLMPEGVFFVGGHPIAGTEHSGAESAFAGLFKGRRTIITPTKKTSKGALKAVTQVWKAAGSEVVIMDAGTHDRVLAAVSHLPHMIAYTLVGAVADLGSVDNGEKIVKYSAGGFRDFTRIASSSPEMWREICELNGREIVSSLDYFMKKLSMLKADIKAKKFDRVQREFERAKNVRDSLKSGVKGWRK
jgi:prephenate dehydrogenase